MIIQAKNYNLWYGLKHVLKNINIEIEEKKITALIGPSGCGKTSLIKSFNRMNDLIECSRTGGEIIFREKNILDRETDVVGLRKSIGMIFQKPNPFPMSIYENVVYGLRIDGENRKGELDSAVEKSLNRAALLEEVRECLYSLGTALSGGQQQRLCIARVIATKPEIILMDEPTSALDPIATAKIEDLMNELKKHYTVIVVTHNMQQAARVADYTGFMYLGELVEFGKTKQIFEKPKNELTENYITGRFG